MKVPKILIGGSLDLCPKGSLVVKTMAQANRNDSYTKTWEGITGPYLSNSWVFWNEEDLETAGGKN